MEGFLRDHMKCMVCLWDRIWPPAPLGTQDVVITMQPQPGAQPKLDMVTALYDFKARSRDELSIQAGEQLCRVRDEGDYIVARKLTGTMDMGLVPSNYVEPGGISNSACEPDTPTQPRHPPQEVHHAPPISNQPWYIEVTSRQEAEQLLKSPPNAHGAYLVRPSDTNPGQYSLSVHNGDGVSHFRIHRDAQGQHYLQHGRTFPSIQELLVFHKTNWKLLKCPLLMPCVTQLVEDTWERPRSEFTLMRKLGQGFFGEVYEGLWNNKQKRVAIKTFKNEDLNRSDFEKEMTALKTLYHENLIQLLAVCSIGEPVYIVTELMTKGNLQEYLKGVEAKRLETADFLYIIRQVAEGMAYLESKHVVHRDLATRNVLVGENLVCKIADFGLARLLKDDLYLPENNRSLPIRWTAPEALAYSKFSSKSDVWSFGVMIYEVFTFGETPYKLWNNRDVYTKVHQGYRLPQPVNCSMEMYDLMLKCWNDKPQERPSFQDLVEQLWTMESTAR